MQIEVGETKGLLFFAFSPFFSGMSYGGARGPREKNKVTCKRTDQVISILLELLVAAENHCMFEVWWKSFIQSPPLISDCVAKKEGDLRTQH